MAYNQPIQRILFGSPGTGKSRTIVKEIIPNQLGIDEESAKSCVIKTVFHPEFTYGDFMGKLLPLSDGSSVKYNYYPGVFLITLAKAFREILLSKYGSADWKLGDDSYTANIKNVVLVIDEINRGNSAAIFGSVFQLLDREEDGWSSYEVTLSDMEYKQLIKLICVGKISLFLIDKDGNRSKTTLSDVELEPYLSDIHIEAEGRKVRIPPNLSIIATMNTSDNSIYYMDTAFKRRWEWEYVSVDESFAKPTLGSIAFKSWEKDWKPFVNKLNQFFKDNHEKIRGIEDKQIGYWFIKGDNITKHVIQSKLMFFVWDSVFSRDKSPLYKLLATTKDDIVTFGDFSNLIDQFIKALSEYTIK